MKAFIQYLGYKSVYVLITVITLMLGYFLIDKGINLPDTQGKTSNILVSIGTSLVATAIVLFLDLWKNFSVDHLMAKTDNIINIGGFEKVYKKRDLDRYDDLMENLGKGIDICGYSLGGFFESFSLTLRAKLQVHSNIKVRVIFVNPRSEAAKKRAEIEGKNIELYKQKFETFKTFYAGIANMEIKTVDFPISSMIFRIDSVLFIGPHFYQHQSKATHTFELRKDSYLFKEYQEEFERMWDDAIPT